MANNANDLVRMLRDFPVQLPSAQIRWEIVKVGDKVKLCPSEPPPILFRGQHTRHSPSYSSIQRGIEIPNGHTEPLSLCQLSLRDQAKYIIDLAKSWWFCEELDSHPAMLWAKQEGIHIDSMTLAQHYELSTGYMDLTQSFAVACFFATCERVEGNWCPKEDGEGIVYRVDYRQLPRILDTVSAIGLQPFPRPSEQWGWVMETLLGQDFEMNPAVSYFRFGHDRSVSEHFLFLFNYGKDLFPPDAMSTVANKIEESRVVPLHLVESVVENVADDCFGARRSEVDSILKVIEESVGLVSEDCRPTMLDTDQLKRLRNDWAQRQHAFFNQVGFRIAR